MATFVQVSKELNTKIKQIKSPEKLLLNLAREMYIITSKRIFTDGAMTNGQKWNYSSKNILAGRSSFSTLAGFNKFAGSKKKRKDLKWVTTKKGATLFEIKGGFKEIKKADNHTNPFDFTGQLRRAYTYDGSKQESYLGFSDTKRKTPDAKETTTTHDQVRSGLEAKQGPIFDLTEKEEKEVDVIIDEYLNVVLGG